MGKLRSLRQFSIQGKAMSFQSFTNDPKAYLLVHQMKIAGFTGAIPSTAITELQKTANASGGYSYQYSHVGNVQMVVPANFHNVTGVGAKDNLSMLKGLMGVQNKRLVNFQVQAGGATPGVRYLPWKPADVTFMELDGAATLALTGPLKGCTLGVVRHQTTGTLWFFHANVGDAGGVNNMNRAVKRDKIRAAGALVGITNAAQYFFCQYGQVPAFDYEGWGFVWGHISGGNWKFYVHAISPGNNVNTTTNKKWAQL